jgi:hypothetical protein
MQKNEKVCSVQPWLAARRQLSIHQPVLARSSRTSAAIVESEHSARMSVRTSVAERQSLNLCMGQELTDE